MKKVIPILILFSLLLTILIGCTPQERIPLGRYFLGDNDEIYIEILADYGITFHNVDFSEVEANLYDIIGDWHDVAANIGSKFDIAYARDRIFVNVYGIYALGNPLALHLDYENGTLTLGSQVFTKR